MGTPNLMINTLLVMDSSLYGKAAGGRGCGSPGGANPRKPLAHAPAAATLCPLRVCWENRRCSLNNPDTLQRVIRVAASEVKISTGRG